MHEQKITNPIIYVSTLLFAEQAINYLIVKGNFEKYLNSNMPDNIVPNVEIFDLSFLFAYVLLTLSCQVLIIRNKTIIKNTRFVHYYAGLLGLNILMNVFFFALQQYYLAMVANIILIVMILLLQIKTWSISKLASLLLVPYLLNITSAAIWLTYFIPLNQ